ncbi:septum site-determining protein MinC [Enterovirga aerilata]|uniref:Probable septum site-determining protein MinC n=1 Tax=Enterovirga aerilata TaxID=2730920 RepID=A0A849ID36_9HYPH|nr:septum site-determining protein MinC [Enterovirga sp. DB1703]
MTSAARPSIRFRGHSLIALVVVPEEPVPDWLAHLDALAQRSPGFFASRPVILDMSHLPHDKDSLRALVGDLFARGIRVMGLEGTEEAILGPDLPPVLSGGNPTGQLDIPTDRIKGQANGNGTRRPASLLVDKPVRSGQSICFPDGDVTIVGSVSSGAEVIAGGSIHVYGTLRGRAVAGSGGDPKARIYCRKLEAELLMIDGSFRTDDEVQPDLRGRPVQAWLDNGAIAIASLD